MAAVARAESEGCRALLGGSSAQSPCADENIGPTAPSPDGFFVAPTVLDRIPLDCAAWREEIFGPVLCCRPFADEGEAVAVANETPYGLGDAVFSADEVRAARVAARLTSGVVWTNCNQALWPATPFGGRKQSGFGWELGEAGLEEYTQRKTLIAAPSGASWGRARDAPLSGTWGGAQCLVNGWDGMGDHREGISRQHARLPSLPASMIVSGTGAEILEDFFGQSVVTTDASVVLPKPPLPKAGHVPTRRTILCPLAKLVRS